MVLTIPSGMAQTLILFHRDLLRLLAKTRRITATVVYVGHHHSVVGIDEELLEPAVYVVRIELDTHRRYAEDAGFDRYVVKPIDCDALKTLLESLPQRRD